jgi:hypothetical protein
VVEVACLPLVAGRVYQVTAARGIGSRLPSLTEPVHDAAAEPVGGRLIIVGGGSGSELSAVESTTGVGDCPADQGLAQPPFGPVVFGLKPRALVIWWLRRAELDA